MIDVSLGVMIEKYKKEGMFFKDNDIFIVVVYCDKVLYYFVEKVWFKEFKFIFFNDCKVVIVLNNVFQEVQEEMYWIILIE